MILRLSADHACSVFLMNTHFNALIMTSHYDCPRMARCQKEVIRSDSHGDMAKIDIQSAQQVTGNISQLKTVFKLHDPKISALTRNRSGSNIASACHREVDAKTHRAQRDCEHKGGAAYRTTCAMAQPPNGPARAVFRQRIMMTSLFGPRRGWSAAVRTESGKSVARAREREFCPGTCVTIGSAGPAVPSALMEVQVNGPAPCVLVRSRAERELSDLHRH